MLLFLVVVVFVVIATTTISADTTLEQLHVITRHGSRTMLSKDADNLAEAGGAALTPLGQQQLYELGSWLRSRYHGNSTSTSSRMDAIKGMSLLKKGNSLKHYNPALHRLESTNTDRTLTSANSLAIGLFPSKTRSSGNSIDATDDSMLYTSSLLYAPAIPVYTDGNDNNDVTLRAYRNCPTFHSRLKNDLYESLEWKNLESQNRYLLQKLGRIFPELSVEGTIPLQDVWNVYDPVHVALTECTVENDNDINSCDAFVPHSTLASAISKQDFDQLERLTEHTEHLKFGKGLDASLPDIVTAGNLLGSNLLQKILKRSTMTNEGDFFLYSTHAPTLLGLLSTLQATDDFYSMSGGERFVDYGSALLVEIHRDDDDEYFFELKYKSTENDDAIDIRLDKSPACNLSDQKYSSWCSLNEIIDWAKRNTLSSEQQWCEACNNKLADVCLMMTSSRTHNQNSNTGMATGNSFDEFFVNDGSPKTSIIITLTFFGGFLVGILLMGLVCCIGCDKNMSSKNTKIEKAENAAATDCSSSDSDDAVGNEGTVINDDDDTEKLKDKEIC
ncbi:phosphoglycerate mutase-like protein [Fragilariopsis cylindrus CCMP1102]|uniref:Phosphoglycerate mutase-like protein n=1 Tax=Fragilariopsis cylindrus CCMP1102 TaxID=635003 RepID=A0A1E7FXV5_9STRA|nr:phosphoglycerate mutase-like protein [Fragilariopsis cylindrus CCMP1102]|eukprot:OEU22966.1 phosphoglycerate mutase-like protein [Fragilariopsis cylindrus CCMP1102]